MTTTNDDLSLDAETVARQMETPETGEDPAPEVPWADAPRDDGALLGKPYRETGARSTDRVSWLLARRTGIGASEIAAVLGESRWGDAGSVYAAKIAPSDDDGAEWLEWGLRLEPVILAAYSSPRYADRLAWPDGRLLRSRDHPWAICTLDAQTCPREEWVARGPESLMPLELKTDRWGRGWEDGPPREYLLQLQHQMLVTGARRASIAVLVGGSQLAWCDAARDEREIARIVRAGERFWRMVERREMPATADHGALARVFAASEERVVDLSGVEWAILDAKRCEVSAVQATAKRELADMDARIKRAMGTARVGRLDDGTEYHWTETKRGRVLRRKEARI